MSGKSVLAEWRADTGNPSNYQCKTYYRSSPNSLAAAVKKLGSEFQVTPRRSLFVGIFILVYFILVYLAKNIPQRPDYHFTLDLIRPRQLSFSVCAIKSARISKHSIAPRNLYSNKLKQELYLL